MSTLDVYFLMLKTIFCKITLGNTITYIIFLQDGLTQDFTIDKEGSESEESRKT